MSLRIGRLKGGRFARSSERFAPPIAACLWLFGCRRLSREYVRKAFQGGHGACGKACGLGDADTHTQRGYQAHSFSIRGSQLTHKASLVSPKLASQSRRELRRVKTQINVL